MTSSRNVAVLLGSIAIIAFAGPGCDGGSTQTGGAAGASTDGGGGMGGAGGAGGDTPTGGAGGTGGTGATGGTGGAGPTDSGAQATGLVSAGGTAKSANFKMVFTLGQSTPNQGRSKSTSYLMQGGLIGATGSLK